MAFPNRLLLSLLFLFSIHFIISIADHNIDIPTDDINIPTYDVNMPEDDLSIANNDINIIDDDNNLVDDSISIPDDDEDINFGDDNDKRRHSYKREFLRVHNRARYAVKVAPVHWNKTLAVRARHYARRCVKNRCQRVPHKHKYGHNVFIGRYRRHHNSTVASYVVKKWVAEKRYYSYKMQKCLKGHVCKHYLQVVSKLTKTIGCAVAKCTKEVYVVACKYRPGKRQHHGDEEFEEVEEDQEPLIMQVTE